MVRAVVEQRAGDRVGEQAPPGTGRVGREPARDRGGDRAVPGQLAGLLIQPEQGGRGDGDLDRGAHPVLARQQRVMDRGDTEIDQGVRAALIDATFVIGGGHRGQRVDRGHQHRRALGGKQRPQLGHAVLAGGDADAAFGQGLLVLLFGAAGVEGVQRHGAGWL